jgi:uncharacterized membrane protein
VSHASWNFYAKKSQTNSIGLIWVAHLIVGLMALPIIVYLIHSDGLGVQGYGFIFASSIIHSVYIYLLGSAYEAGEISVVYPIARGTGIAGTAVIATSFGVDSLSITGIIGVACVFLGTIVIGLHKTASLHSYKMFYLPFLVGCSIASYSVVDKIAVGYVSPILHVCATHLGAAAILLPWVVKKIKPEVTLVLSTHKVYAGFIGLAGIVTYGLILWAFQLSQASYVVALRETSILIAVALGVVLLKESFSTKKAYGVSLVIIGAIFVKFA